MAPKPNEFNVVLLYILIGLMVLTGTVNTVANKNLLKLPIKNEQGQEETFGAHQFFVTCLMFIGEMFSLCPYSIILFRQFQAKKNGEEEFEKLSQDKEESGEKTPDTPSDKKPNAKFYIFVISAMCDFIASTIGNFALYFLPASIYQMFRGIELFFICIFSKIFLKNHVYSHHILGVGTVIVGLICVGLSNFIEGDQELDKENLVIGICLLVCSQCFSSTQYIVQELFIKKYEVNSFQLVGFEGFWGFSVYVIFLIIAQNISCNSFPKGLKKRLCYTIPGQTSAVLENTLYAFKQLKNSVALMLLTIAYIMSIALYNIVGINLTQLVSSTARAIVDTVRTVFIWLFFLLFHPVKGTEETFKVLQLIGFILLISGTCIYNEIVEIPCAGLNTNTRSQQKKRLEAEKEEEEKTKDGEEKEKEEQQYQEDKKRYDEDTEQNKEEALIPPTHDE